MSEYEDLRDGLGRRQQDIACAKHDERLEAIEADVHKNSGKFASMLWFMGIAGGFIGACLVFLVAKTTAIESLLTDNKVALMQHTEQISTLRSDVKEIQERNRYIDQNGMMRVDK